MHIDLSILEQYFLTWKKYVEVEDKRILTSFRSSPFLRKEEGYKDEVFEESNKYLNVLSWRAQDIGTGKILQCVIDSVEKNKNNLIYTSQHNYTEQGSPVKKLKDLLSENKTMKLELTLYELFYDKTTPGRAFDTLVEIIGHRYSLITYIFFLKDDRSYIPVAPEAFEKKLQRININLPLAHQCSWENYSELLKLINEIQQFLKEQLLTENVFLIDAHSFVWMLWILDKKPLEKGSDEETELLQIEIDLVNKSNHEISLEPSNIETSKEMLEKSLDKKRVTGLSAELAVLKYELNRGNKISHTSEVNISKGYDIESITPDGIEKHIEVKTAHMHKDRINFYISLNELKVARTDDKWVLYAVTLQKDKHAVSPISRDFAVQALEKIEQMNQESCFTLLPKNIYVQLHYTFANTK
jgi:hypothetical protein